MLRPACVFGLCAFVLLATTVRAQEDDDLKRPGLEAVYSLPQAERVVVREEATPALLLAAGESPDPRLPSSGWRAKWSGVLEILKPGKYRLAAETSGKLAVRVAGREALSLEAAPGAAREGIELDLKFGLHPLEIEFTPAGEGTRLKLFWSSEHFPREPLPAFAVGRAPGSAELRDPFAEQRLAVEEHSCTACHKPSADAPISVSLLTRPGPRLSSAGSRMRAAWIYHWLADPQAHRPQAVMPRLFGTDKQADLERYAVATFLATLGKPSESVAADPAQAKTGEGLFQSIGCAVCHEKQGDRPPRATLQKLAGKTTIPALASFLSDTAAVDPAGRMPGFDLPPGQSTALAHYLVGREPGPALELPRAPSGEEVRKVYFGREPSASEMLAFSSLSPEKQLSAIGRRVFENRQCANCHELKLPGENAPLAAKPAVADFGTVGRHLTTPAAGKVVPACLAAAGSPSEGKSPVFGDTFDRAGAAEFFKTALKVPGTRAPGELARLSLVRFNCTGCHERNSRGGLDRDFVARLLENQTEANAESVMPPALSGVTEKLLGSYLAQVLVEGRRARPWMGLKMPKFGKEHVAALPAGLAALDGVALADKPFLPTPDPALAAAGRTLVGSQGFGCTKCHDMLGVASQGTRGPELTLTAERVNFDWYHRWMTDPQRLQPGTRMPTVFLGGESPYKTVLKGDPQQQRLAVWHYLLAARDKTMSAPEGLEAPKIVETAPTKGDKPQLMRTFLGGTTPRGIAIRYPNGVHLAYDAQSCHLAFGWSGEFLEMGPVWNGRGGNKAGLKGPTFWTAPAGFPWEVSSSQTVPDFSGRGKDYALGAELPQDGKTYPTRLHFKGYSSAGSVPVFKFELQLEGDQKASFTEGVSSLKSDAGNGTLRELQVSAPAGQYVWLAAGQSEVPPEWRTSDGATGRLDSETSQAPAGALITLTAGGKATLLHLRSAPTGAVWLAARQQGKWVLVLRMTGQEGTKASLATWSPGDAAGSERISAEEMKAK